MVPGPQSRATRRVSLSSQATSLFGVGEDEAVFDEFAGLEIELAEGVGVFAAGGEGDEAEAVAGVEAVEALLRPTSRCLCGEGVVVEDGVPVGLVGEVAGEGGAAEDAADVLGVLPGVVDVAYAELRVGETCGGFEDFEGSFGESRRSAGRRRGPWRIGRFLR